MADKRIMVIANKWWETEPLINVLLHDKARPTDFSSFTMLCHPVVRVNGTIVLPEKPLDTLLPRLTFVCSGAKVEVWCIEDYLASRDSSNTQKKADLLEKIFALDATMPNLVIAFGTAGSREGAASNGSVVIGRRLFLHKSDPPKDKELDSDWTPPVADKVVETGYMPGGRFQKELVKASGPYRAQAEMRFISPPVAPSSAPMILVGNGFISLGVLNITNYDDYAWADRQAVQAFSEAPVDGQIGSIETTHGVIWSMSKNAPFVYVSGITDTEGLFDWQVTPREYAQNYAAAHNAGIALAWLLPLLVSFA